MDGFFVNLHATACTNRCLHCWADGSPKHRPLPAERVLFVLERAAEASAAVPCLGFLLLDEPTTHPQFVGIVERAAELGLIGESAFLPTNGSVLARAPDAVWERLGRTGLNWLQLTFYGLEATHDAFARRRGAFRDLLATIRRAPDHGFEWYAGVVIHAGSLGELQDTIHLLESLHASGDAMVGWIPFLWQGRGRDAPRVRAEAYAQLPESLRAGRTAFLTEAEAARRIAESPELAGRRGDEALCSTLVLDVDRDMRIRCGRACDGGGPLSAVPELADQFFLGTLDDGGFPPLLEAYEAAPPAGHRLLAAITWGELAERYGEESNDEMYYLDDLPLNKWAGAYLNDAVRHGLRC